MNEISRNNGELQGAFQIEGGWKYFRTSAPSAQEALFNVLTDPSETMDLQDSNRPMFETMKQEFEVQLCFRKR